MWPRRRPPDRAAHGPQAPWGRALLRGGPAAYVRARLHRRIFAWFGLSILVTGLVLGAVGMLIGGVTGSSYSRDMERANAFVGHQFEKVWSAPAERDALAQEIARDFDVRVEMRDTAGEAIEPFSEACKRPIFSSKIPRTGDPVGEVRICATKKGSRWGLLAVVIAGLVLWAASGRIARRLARPLGELARVAQDLGRGKLDSRVSMGCHEHGEVGVVAEAMNDMAARIQKQLADQRELLATVSHELRTPLARIRLLTEIARDGGDPLHAFDEIDREVVDIDQLVGDLLASSRVDFSALSTTDLSAAETAQRAVSRAGLDPEVVLSIAPEDKSLRVAADPTLLARALANLIDNAARHGGGVCRVVVRGMEDRVIFEVEDDGPGLAPGEEHRIFEAFYQGNGTANGEPKKGALGLGLALVRRIAEAHGGRAYAENRAEGGARIGLEIPSRPPSSG